MASSPSSSSGSSSSGSSASSPEPDELVALASTLIELNSSLSQLERSFLQPLLSTPLKDTLAALPKGDLDRAKLHVALAYVVCDLVWIHFKTKGINPEGHPVVDELRRIKGYYGKLANAENPQTRTMKVDQPAAARFIKAALGAQASAQAPSAAKASAEQAEIGMQTRFNVLKYQEAVLRDSSPSVASSGEDSDSDEEVKDVKGKGKATAAPASLKVDLSAKSSSLSPAPSLHSPLPSPIDPSPNTPFRSPAPAPASKASSKKKKAKGKPAAAPATASSTAPLVVDAAAQERAIVGSPLVSVANAGGASGSTRAKRGRVDVFAGYESPATPGGESRSGSPAAPSAGSARKKIRSGQNTPSRTA